MSLVELLSKIEQRQAVIGVIGLGYVGLPVACMFAQAGFGVIGLDIKEKRIEMINAGHSPIDGEEPGLPELLAEVVGAGRLQATTNYADLAQADVVLIDVETPVDNEHKPQYVALRAACRRLGPVLKNEALVIVESTIAPGTIDSGAPATGRNIGQTGSCRFLSWRVSRTGDARQITNQPAHR